MTEISEGLRDRIFSQLEDYKPQLAAFAAGVDSSAAEIVVPVMIDGVWDSITYSTTERRFIYMIICVGKGRMTHTEWLGKYAGYADDVEFVTIPLPEDFLTD